MKEGLKNDGGSGSHRRTGAAGAVAMAVDHATEFLKRHFLALDLSSAKMSQKIESIDPEAP